MNYKSCIVHYELCIVLGGYLNDSKVSSFSLVVMAIIFVALAGAFLSLAYFNSWVLASAKCLFNAFSFTCALFKYFNSTIKCSGHISEKIITFGSI